MINFTDSSGLTLSAKLLGSDNQIIEKTLAEISPGFYRKEFAAGELAADTYIVAIFAGVELLGNGVLRWDGEKEILPLAADDYTAPESVNLEPVTSKLATIENKVDDKLDASDYTAPESVNLEPVTSKLAAIENKVDDKLDASDYTAPPAVNLAPVIEAAQDAAEKAGEAKTAANQAKAAAEDIEVGEITIPDSFVSDIATQTANKINAVNTPVNTLTVRIADTSGSSVDGATVALTIDPEGKNTIYRAITNSLGDAVLCHDLPAGTQVYIWAEKARHCFQVPIIKVIE